MDFILDCIRAALPWVAMGLLLAIFFARSAVKKKKGEKQKCDYGIEGMCLGMCIGTVLGTAIGSSLGMLVGLAIGSFIQKDQENQDK